SDAGTKTCAGRPGSRGHEFQDALSYARWGVDYLKYDWCNTGSDNAEAAYATMHDALVEAAEKTKHPITFSLCEWGTAKPWLWAMLAAPLIAGNDVRAMSPQTAEILMNKEVIAVDQDPLGIEGQRVTPALPGRLLPEGATAAANATTGDAAKTAEPAHPEVET